MTNVPTVAEWRAGIEEVLAEYEPWQHAAVLETARQAMIQRCIHRYAEQWGMPPAEKLNDLTVSLREQLRPEEWLMWVAIVEAEQVRGLI